MSTWGLETPFLGLHSSIMRGVHRDIAGVTVAVALSAAIAFGVASNGRAGGGGGGGWCVPFDVVGATGELWTIGVVGSQNQNDGPDITNANAMGLQADADMSSGGSFGRAVSTYSISGGDLFGYGSFGSAAAAAANGTNAFARSDVLGTWHLTTTASMPQRVRLMWQLEASGIASIQWTLRRAVASQLALVAEDSLSVYITPEVRSDSRTVMIPAGQFQLFVAGTVQANAGFANPDAGLHRLEWFATCLPLADLDGSGAVDGADLAAVLAAWGQVPAFAAADLNQDLVVDGLDLAAVLAAW